MNGTANGAVSMSASDVGRTSSVFIPIPAAIDTPWHMATGVAAAAAAAACQEMSAFRAVSCPLIFLFLFYIL